MLSSTTSKPQRPTSPQLAREQQFNAIIGN